MNFVLFSFIFSLEKNLFKSILGLFLGPPEAPQVMPPYGPYFLVILFTRCIGPKNNSLYNFSMFRQVYTL